MLVRLDPKQFPKSTIRGFQKVLYENYSGKEMLEKWSRGCLQNCDAIHDQLDSLSPQCVTRMFNNP